MAITQRTISLRAGIPAATVTGTPLDRVPGKRTARASQNRKIVMAVTARVLL